MGEREGNSGAGTHTWTQKSMPPPLGRPPHFKNAVKPLVVVAIVPTRPLIEKSVI